MLFNLLQKKSSMLIAIIFIFYLFSCTNNFTVALANSSDDLYSKWELNGDAYITDEGYLVLTEAKDWQKGGAWYKEDVIGTFNVSFRYKMGGGNGADGIIFAFDKNIDNLGDSGGNLGFGKGGYGVEFDTYINGEYNDPSQQHISFIKGTISNHIDTHIDVNLNDNEWHDVTIKVSTTSIEVIVDDQTVINYHGPITQNNSNIGFMAATGSFNDWHMIDLNSFYVEVLDTDGGNLVNPDNGHIYLLGDGNVTFPEAEKICKNLGGYVATITSQREQEFIYQNYLLDGTLDSYYLGGTDEALEKNWKWLTGEEFSYSNWASGEPNGWGIGGKEDYLTIRLNSGEWNDVSKSSRLGYICEFDSIDNDWKLPKVKSVTLNYAGKTLNVLRENITILPDDTKEYKLEVLADWQGIKPKEIILQQGNKKIISEDGIFNLNLAEVFNTNDSIYVLLVGENEIISEAKKINISFNSSSGTDMPSNLTIDNASIVKTPDFIPLIGDVLMSMGFGNIRMSTEYDATNDLHKVIIGHGSEPVDFENFFENWQKAKTAIDIGRAYGGERIRFDFTDTLSFNVDVLGYLELKGGNLQLISGGIIINGNVNKPFKANHTIFWAGPVPIPVYYTSAINMDLEVDANISKSTDIRNGILELDTKLELEPTWKPEGGVGVHNALSLGIIGKLGGNLNLELPEEISKPYFVGGLGITGQFLVFEGELPFFEIRWPSYETQQFISNFNPYSMNSYQLMNRDYLKNQTPWNSEEVNLLNEIQDYSNQDVTILQQGIYPDSRPEIMMINDQKIIIWIRDNEERSSINRTELVFSIYDESNQKWSEPKAIYDDGTGDFYPQIAKDENNLYVVWQNINEKFLNDDVTIDTLAKHSDIMISKFNNEMNKFDQPTSLTSDEYYDGLPMVSVKDGEIALTWIRNSENDIFGQNHKNEIMFKYYRNGKWEDTQVLIGKQSIINSLDIVNNGQEQYAIYSLDVDNNPLTIDDQELVLISMNRGKVIKTEQITTNNVIDSSPQFINLDNSIGLFYYSDNQLVFSEDINEIKPNPVFKEGQGLGTDNYQILNDNNKLVILWTKNTEDSIEVFSVNYDEELKEFGNEIVLTHVDNRIKEFDALLEDNGSILLVANVAEKIENQVNDLIYYSDGISSLALIEVNPLEDLTINQKSLFIDETSYIINQAIPITFEVINNGQEISQGFKVEVFDKSSLSPNYTTTVNKTLKSGESSLVEVQFTPKEAKQYSGVIKITPLRGQDAFEGNNTTTFTVGSSDPYIKDITSSTIDDKLSINMVLSNTSVISSENITVNIREDNEEGNVLYTTVVKKLESDVDVRLDYELDTVNLKFDEDRKKVLYVELISENDEKYTYNNSEFIVVTNPYQKEDVNRDNKIDSLDLAEITNNYNLQYDDNEFDFKYDINRDGIIDLYDFVLISKEIQQ